MDLILLQAKVTTGIDANEKEINNPLLTVEFCTHSLGQHTLLQ